MNVSDLLVDLTTPIQNSRRKSDNVVDLTEEDEDIQFIQPPTKRQKQRLSNQQSTIQPFPILEPPALDPAFSTTHRERRAAQYVSSPSKELLTRIQRSQNSKLFLIQQKPQQPDRLEKDFVIYGTNGNVYTVTIGQKPQCDCEENQRGQFPVHCEHILFVYLKVLRRSSQDPVVFQKALLRTELTELFSSAGSVTPSVLADPCVTEKYLEIMRADRKKPKKSVPQKPIDGDCPVCYEKMKPSEDLIYCKHSCGNSIHKECFDQWRRVRKEANQEARCIYCRSKWEEDPESIKKALMKNGYLNLSEFQTTIRDIPHPYYFLLPQLLRLSDRFNFDLSNDLNDSSDDEDYYDGESGEDLENTDNEDEDF